MIKTTKYSSRALLVLAILIAANANAQPRVIGDEIVLPAGDWFQVQDAESFESFCEGLVRCRVGSGTYIVINHSTGERFEDIVVDGNGDAPTSNSTNNSVQVNGNQISWPNDGWYQVQRSSDYSSVCEGGRSCNVDDDEYVVINHTSMQRFENIRVGGNQPSSNNPGPMINSSDVTVQGNIISWTDNGWYQVQDASSFNSVCEGGSSCTVPAGTYIVINHTTGERFQNITVGTEIVEPTQTESGLINPVTWPDILRNAITTLNGVQVQDLHDQVRMRINSLTRFAMSDSSQYDPATGSQELLHLGLTLQPLQNPDNLRRLDYICSNGGTLTLVVSRVSQWDSLANNCVVEDLTLNGSFVANFVGREGGRSTLNNVSFNFANGNQFSISGEHSTSFDRIGLRRSISWNNMNFSEVSGSSNYTVTDFNVIRNSETGTVPGESNNTRVELDDGSIIFATRVLHNASAIGSYLVTADWTSFQSFTVNSDLSLRGSFLDPIETERAQQWTDGSFSVVAPDGSSVTLEPLPDDDSQALVTISGVEGTQLVSWSDGFQVFCFANRSDISLCQPE